MTVQQLIDELMKVRDKNKEAIVDLRHPNLMEYGTMGIKTVTEALITVLIRIGLD